MRPWFSVVHLLPVFLLAAAVVCCFAASSHAQGVTAPGAKLEAISKEFKFTEGPASDAEGNVYFTDQPNDRIMRYGVDGKMTTFMQPCGRSNGLCFDNQGNLIACADEKNEMWSIDVKTKKVTVLFHDYQGKLLNGPNDVWVRPDGGMYFTDPLYARDYWHDRSAKSEQPVHGVYYFDPKTSGLKLVAADLKQPNGIIGTPDGNTLYASDIDKRKIWAWTIQPDGSLTDKKFFADARSDGMTIDAEGNVYVTNDKDVTVFDKGGKEIERIVVEGKTPANICFGGKDMHTLFITAKDGFYAIKMRVKGAGSQ